MQEGQYIEKYLLSDDLELKYTYSTHAESYILWKEHASI